MENFNFWDCEVWGVFNLVAVLLGSLLAANSLKKLIPALKKSLIPSSVLGGILLLIVAIVYESVTGNNLFNTSFFGGNGAYEELWVRIVAFIIGEITTSIGIAFFFRTNWPVQTYELFVCEIADKFSLDKNKVKLGFDIVFFVLSAAMSLLLTGGFNGFGIGTVIITFVNAPLIALIGKILDRFFEFDPLFSFSKKT